LRFGVVLRRRFPFTEKRVGGSPYSSFTSFLPTGSLTCPFPFKTSARGKKSPLVVDEFFFRFFPLGRCGPLGNQFFLHGKIPFFSSFALSFFSFPHSSLSSICSFLPSNVGVTFDQAAETFLFLFFHVATLFFPDGFEEIFPPV